MPDADPPAPVPAATATEPRPYSAEDWRTLWRRRPWLVFGGGGVVVVALVFLWLVWGLPLSKALEPLASPTLVLVTDDGTPFARRGAYKEAPVDAAALPQHVTMAFVSIEDRRFYRHGGIDARAIVRAFVRNLGAGSVHEGGSTITQQLAKNAFLTNTRSYRRKAREAIIALYLEGALSKNEILSRYLSSAYFGDGVFGLRAAARHFFDKTPETLTVGEAALLAGVVKAPSKLAPTVNLAAARTRMAVVLRAMVETGVLSEVEARAAANVRVRQGRPQLPVGSYFADWVEDKAKQRFDRAYGEVRVATTLDAGLQARAEQALSRVMAGGDKVHATQAALVAMRTDGRVVAMVGGRNYGKSQFNRAAQAKRQPGSAFKPVVYLAAFRKGATPDSLVLDAPIKVGDWAPQNHEGQYNGNFITLRQAFARSSNVAAVRLGQDTGHGAIVRAARDLGITADLPDDPTIALGTASLTLLELTSAYAAIATGASPVTPRGLAQERAQPVTNRLGDRERQALLDILHAVVAGGTGAGADPGVTAFGKTGTSQDYRDAWFVGFAGDLVVGVWVGNDDNTPMKRVVGGGLPAQIWKDVMRYAAGRPEFRGGPAANFAPAMQVVEAPLEDSEAPLIDPIEDQPLPPFMLDGPPPRFERRRGRFEDDPEPFSLERPPAEAAPPPRRNGPRRPRPDGGGPPDDPRFEELLPDAVG